MVGSLSFAAILCASAVPAFQPVQAAAEPIQASAPTSSPLILTGDVERLRLPSGHELLELHGEVINGTDQVQEIPPILAELKDAEDRVLDNWTIAPPVRELPPRARAGFESARIDVPPHARRVSLSFGPMPPTE